MTLILNQEQQALRDSVRAFVAERTPLRRVREVIASPDSYSADTWRQMTGQLGLAGLAIPEAYGGAGAGQTALSVAMFELGAGLVPSPLLASAVLAAAALLRLDDEAARKEVLPGIASGELIGTLAVTDIARTQTTAAGDMPDARLTGEQSPVLNGADADLILVPARHRGQIATFLVKADAEGLTRTPLTAVDHTRALARLRFDATPARALAGDAARALAAAGEQASLALAAEQSGGMAACLAMTTDYAKLRVAFGQPIGAFQGVKHRLADMRAAWELGYAALREATRCADEDPAALPAAAAAARALISPAYFRAAADTVLLHGGIGYTWEHDAHLYYKNALSGKVLLGDPDAQLDALATALGM
jgi:alkylation response protein AidB-like acyl-CoA dehydrogenase